jgi:hypothetical protein
MDHSVNSHEGIKMVGISVEKFLREYTQALLDGNAALFAGAGLSIPAGMVDWKDLLRDIASDIGLDVDKETDLVSVAQFHVNERGGRHRINQSLVKEFAVRARQTPNHKILASLPIKTYWTTNYDTLIEDAIIAVGRRPEVKIEPENLAVTIPKSDSVVYKMHGDVSQPDKTTVTKEDYEIFEDKRSVFSMTLKGDLLSKTFLFMGFSFSDPNIGYILARVRALLGHNHREHYCLLKRVQRTDFNKRKEFEYAVVRQELQVKDLQRYGILGVLVDSYDHCTEVLQRVEQRYRRNCIFISGSAVVYDPWNQSDAEDLVQQIARLLVKRGFVIVTGFGLGIGPHVINGVLGHLEEEGLHDLDKHAILRPFPYAIHDDDLRKRRWHAYREEMIPRAGIALFLFGNKRDKSGEIVLADGVAEEFAIAQEHGLKLIPVGCTGSVAKNQCDMILGNFGTFYDDREYLPLMEALQEKDEPQKVADRVVGFVTKLREEC